MINQVNCKGPGTIRPFRIHCSRGEHLWSETSQVWNGILFCVFNWQQTIFKCVSYLSTLNTDSKKENVVSYSFRRD